jgi:hypothetical protein
MKKISAILFFSITLLFSSATMAQNSNPWVGKWDLQIQADVRTVFATLKIEFEGNNLAGTIEFEGNETPQVIDHFNDSDTELILGFKMEDSDDLIFPLTLRKKVDGMISGSFESKNGAGEQILLNVIVEKVSDDSGMDVPQSNPWVGLWNLNFTDVKNGEISTNILEIWLQGNNLAGRLASGPEDYASYTEIEHFNVSTTELILGWTYGGTDELVYPLTINLEDDGTLSGSFNNDTFEASVIGKKIDQGRDDRDGDLAQSSNPWDGQFNLDFKNIDDKETNFVATLNVDYVNDKLEGYIIYFYKDGTKEEVVIKHFNDSDTELILGFKVEGSDALFFPLTLRINDYGSISGSWEDKEESYTIEGFRIAPI